MNAKKAKQLRKTVAAMGAVADVPPVITLHERLMFNGMPHAHKVVNPIRYPAGSSRRVYQAIKRGRPVVPAAPAAAPAKVAELEAV
jgi:hypothetical protein